VPPDQAETDVLAARLARARLQSVMICTPVARHPVRQYSTSLLRTAIRLTDLGIRCYIQHVVGNSNLPRARNELAAAFMASDYTAMLFIDDDMSWQPDDVVRLLASDKPLVAGIGCKKVERADTDPDKWCLRTLPGGVRQDEMGAIEVRGVGTGFVKIERCVFEGLAAAHPEWKRRGWPNMPDAARARYYRFFQFPDDEDETGEDLWFCDQYRAIGGEVWIDPTIRLGHVGEKEYSGNFAALLEAAP
jgi:hypothetical protein